MNIQNGYLPQIMVISGAFLCSEAEKKVEGGKCWRFYSLTNQHSLNKMG